VPEIAKSVVFVGKSTAVVVLSGDRRVDVPKLSQLAGEGLRVAKPDEVRDRTGFPIGGVPPFPHGEGVTVYPDSSLGRFQHVWAAAGTPNTVFRIGTSDLLRLVGRGPFDVAAQMERL
jgi:prolyl-tRNA editing enzyme YbaK/EbsC (Cys-tRNA(Pro) deacylase)